MKKNLINFLIIAVGTVAILTIAFGFKEYCLNGKNLTECKHEIRLGK